MQKFESHVNIASKTAKSIVKREPSFSLCRQTSEYEPIDISAPSENHSTDQGVEYWRNEKHKTDIQLNEIKTKYDAILQENTELQLKVQQLETRELNFRSY